MEKDCDHGNVEGLQNTFKSRLMKYSEITYVWAWVVKCNVR
jgi:hypothetical protein